MKPPRSVTNVGPYQLLRKLGRGGFTEVFLASRDNDEKLVAFRVLSKELARHEDSVQRFLRSARMWFQMNHSGVVKIFAVDNYNGIHFVVTEYVERHSLQHWMNEVGMLSVGDALQVTLMVAEALKHLHANAIIHRDVKGANLLIDHAGRVKLDISPIPCAEDTDVSMTQSGTGLGAPLYMSPEQARSVRHLRPTSDIYSLGGVLYHMLTASVPFVRSTALELMMAKETGERIPARQLNPEVPASVEDLIERMMHRSPEERIQTADQVIDEIQALKLAAPELSFTA